MLHRTITPPFFRFRFQPSSSSVSPFAPPPATGFLQPPSLPTATPPYLRSSQVEREATMEEAALKNYCRPEALPSAAAVNHQHQHQHQQQGLFADDVAWAVERGNLLGEEFSVDDLLDFGGLETEKEAEEEEEEEEEEEAKAEAFEADNSNTSSALSFEAPLPLSDISLPAHDATEFEWMSHIIDDSVSEFLPCPGVPPYRPASQNQTQAKNQHHEPQPEDCWTRRIPPVPKTFCRLSTEALVPVKAKRSKRSRTAGSSWPAFGAGPFSDSSASTTTTTTTATSYSSPSSPSCSSSPSYSSYLIYNHAAFVFDGNPAPPKKHKPKKRGRKPKHQHPPHAAAAAVGGGVGAGERRCSHCGAQKTPQWRAGPMGPKTLCNACGVRYKSGRLVPEYRPAASPTFVSHVHSNSHRKVLEMRRKKEEQTLAAAAPPVASF